MAEGIGEYGALWARAAQQGVTALRAVALAACVAALAACSGATSGGEDAGGGESPTSTTPDVAAAGANGASSATGGGEDASGDAANAPRSVLVFGDSLSAAYNLAAEQGWVALLDGRMRDEAPGFRMVNASISGETTAGGVARVDAALAEHRPALFVLALGANDGLRGLPLAQTRANLERMVRAAKASGADVLVVGMRLPPNYGPEYTEAFFALFGEIARAEGARHLPFLLEPIAFDDSAFQADRLHPTAEAQPALAEHVWAALSPMLAEAGRGTAAATAPDARPAG